MRFDGYRVWWLFPPVENTQYSPAVLRGSLLGVPRRPSMESRVICRSQPCCVPFQFFASWRFDPWPCIPFSLSSPEPCPSSRIVQWPSVCAVGGVHAMCCARLGGQWCQEDLESPLYRMAMRLTACQTGRGWGQACSLSLSSFFRILTALCCSAFILGPGQYHGILMRLRGRGAESILPY